jgi:hypothetical protein
MKSIINVIWQVLLRLFLAASPSGKHVYGVDTGNSSLSSIIEGLVTPLAHYCHLLSPLICNCGPAVRMTLPVSADLPWKYLVK